MSASIPWSSNFRSTVYDYSSSDDDVSDTEGTIQSHRQSSVTTYANEKLPFSEFKDQIESQKATKAASTAPLYADLDTQEEDITFTETPFTIAKRQAFFRRQRASTNGSIHSVATSQQAPSEDQAIGHLSPNGSFRALSVSASSTASARYHTSTNSTDTTATQLLTSPPTEPSVIGAEHELRLNQCSSVEQAEAEVALFSHDSSKEQPSIDQSDHRSTTPCSNDPRSQTPGLLSHRKEFPALRPAHLALDKPPQGASQSRLCFQPTSRRTLETVQEQEYEDSEVSTPHRRPFRGSESFRSQSPSVASDASTSIFGEGFYSRHNSEHVPQVVPFSLPSEQVQRSSYFAKNLPRPAETASSPWLSPWSSRKRPLSAVDEERLQSRGTSPSNYITISDSDEDHDNVFAYDPHRGTLPLVSNQLPFESPERTEQPVPLSKGKFDHQPDTRAGSWIQEELQKWRSQKASVHHDVRANTRPTSHFDTIQHTGGDTWLPGAQDYPSSVLEELQKWRDQRQTNAKSGVAASTHHSSHRSGIRSPSHSDARNTSASQRLSLYSYSPTNVQGLSTNHQPFMPDDTATTRARKRQHVERSVPSMTTTTSANQTQSKTMSARFSSIQSATSRRFESCVSSTRSSGSRYRFHNAPTARGKAIALKRFRLPLLPSRPPQSKLPQERRDIEGNACSTFRTALQPLDQNRREAYSIKRVPPGMQIQVETQNIGSATDGTGAAAARRLTLFKPSPLPSDA